LYALAAGLSAAAVGVLAAAIVLRVATCALVALQLEDEETLRALPWLPLRDLLALVSWALALTRRSFVWRGHRFRLAPGGRIIPRDETA
jgi:ceramide glucosyltransferase